MTLAASLLREMTLICVLIGSGFFVQAQLTQEEFKDLLFYSDVAVNAKHADNRLRANRVFVEQFEKLIERPNSFSYQFEDIPFLTCLMPPDSSFKLLSFSVMDEQDRTTNHCYLIQQSNNRVTSMKPVSFLDDLEYEILDAQSWLPALYYHIIPYQFKGENVFLLFGYTQLDKYEKRKVLDVLSFQDAEPIFGKELFIKKQKDRRDIVKTRLMFQYSADISLMMQHDKNYKSVVIDHLMEVRSKIPGAKRNVLVPDGTYISYAITEEGLIYNNMLFDENISQPADNKTNDTRGKSRLFKQKSKN